MKSPSSLLPLPPKPPSRSGSFPCPDCQKQFSRKEYVERHRRLKHLDQRSFVCECSKAFARSDLLRRHQKNCGGDAAPKKKRKQSSTAAIPILNAGQDDRRQMSVDIQTTLGENTVSPNAMPSLSPASINNHGTTESEPVQTPPSPPKVLLDRKRQHSLDLQSNDGQNGLDDVENLNLALPSLEPFSHSIAKQSPARSPYQLLNIQPINPVTLIPPNPTIATYVPPTTGIFSMPATTTQTTPNMAPVSLTMQTTPAHAQYIYNYQVPSSPSLAAILNGPTSNTLVQQTFTLEDVFTNDSLNYGVETPWHGSRFADNSKASNINVDAYNEPSVSPPDNPIAGLLLDSDNNLSIFDQLLPNDIENSLEVNALASYFNKGGVGGITALDLGFSYEPSLVPSNLLNLENGAFPDNSITSDLHFNFGAGSLLASSLQVGHTAKGRAIAPLPSTRLSSLPLSDRVADDHRFFLPTQKFCIGYLYPWHVPPLPTLSRYAKEAANRFIPNIPVVHGSTLVMSKLHNATAFAITVAGASYFPEGEQFSREMLVEKRVYILRTFNKSDATFEDRFSYAQSFLLYQLLGMFHPDKNQKTLSQTFHGSLVQMAKTLNLPKKINDFSKTLRELDEDLTGPDLEKLWKSWIEVETWRRVAFIVLLCDLEISTEYECSPLYIFSDLDIEIPTCDELWNAKDAPEWKRIKLDPKTSTSHKFLDIIRALLAPTTLPILDSLPNASPFSLLVLTRVLTFLEARAEEAIKTHDPFRDILGGMGLFAQQDKECVMLVDRIRKGLAFLKEIPGGNERGGGEKWYEGVLPSRTPSTPANTFDETRFPQPANEPDYGYGYYTPGNDNFSTHVENAKQKVASNWPEFMVDLEGVSVV